MQKVVIIFYYFSFFFVLQFFIACSSSTYTERSYKEKKINKPTDLPVINEEVEEEALPQIPYDDLALEQKSIIERIYSNIKESEKKKIFFNEIINYLNTPYQYGGSTESGIDCSAFTQNVYQNSLGVNIPRTARDQFKIGEVFEDRDLLKFGDLIFFDTSSNFFPGHVGIYLENDLFAHASSSKGVIISSLNNYYYTNRFVGANRVKVKK